MKAKMPLYPVAPLETEGKGIYYCGLFAGVVAVSFAAIFIRLADAPALAITAWRLSIASLVMIPGYVPASRGELSAASPRFFVKAAISGVLLGLHFFVWIASLNYTSVTASVVLVTTNPIFVAAASWALLGEAMGGRKTTGILISIAGGVILGWEGLSEGGRVLMGDLLALFGAAFFSAHLLIGRSIRKQAGVMAYISVVYPVAATFSVLSCLAAGVPLFGYSAKTYLMMLLLALIPQVAGHTLLNWALGRLTASFVAVSLLGEPIGATVLAWLILKESPTPATAFGAALILSGIYICAREEYTK